MTGKEYFKAVKKDYLESILANYTDTERYNTDYLLEDDRDYYDDIEEWYLTISTETTARARIGKNSLHT